MSSVPESRKPKKGIECDVKPDASLLDAFCLENVRCFGSQQGRPQEVRVRPLTFLVGENSTGKSTVLGCMQALADYMDDFGADIDFNRHPYEMGSFREIARRSRPLVQSFKLGMSFRNAVGQETARYLVELHEREGGARAAVKEVTWQLGNLRVVLLPSRSLARTSRHKIQISSRGPDSFQLELAQPWFGRYQDRPWLWRHLIEREQRKPTPEADAFLVAVAHRIDGMRQRSWDALSPAKSIAPIRSKPERTYNPFFDEPDAEGSEIPAELASSARKGGTTWNDLKARLERFGREASLFSEIGVRKLGKSGSDPFQLQVKARGPRANIKDVGYGVSQILPILVRLAHPVPRAETVLIQQPEVHLHPRGQAALSSILIGLLGSTGRSRRELPSRFVIETHSDYMIDRARIAIQRKEIKPDDVSLVYLEPKSRGGVTVNNICFDELGNMKRVPKGYREFFLTESDALLGFGE